MSRPRKYRFRIPVRRERAILSVVALTNGGVFQQIGTDQGLLASPAAVERLTIAPGERADVVLDFTAHRGENESRSQSLSFRC